MKKFLKQFTLGILIFIIVNIIISIIYGYPTYKSIKNKTNKNYLKWKAIHQNENTYDLVIIGTSRTYTAFNPTIIDSVLKTNSYNMATSAQDIAETYYSLQEIFEYQKPKYVILDLFFESSDNTHHYYQTFSNSSFFNSTERKLNLITEGYGATGIINYTIPVVKFKNYIKQDIAKFFDNNKTRIKQDNWIKGYLRDTTEVSKSQILNFEPISNFENTTFNKERFNNYFNKINDLVSSNNSKLICVRTPYPPSRLALNKIDDEGNYFEYFTKKIKIPYYDLNTFKSTEYKYINSDFSDYHHPNYRGAEKASKQLIEIINLN